MISYDNSLEVPETAESIINRPVDKICVTSSVRSLGMTARQAVESFHIILGVATFGSVVLARVEIIGSDMKIENQAGKA